VGKRIALTYIFRHSDLKLWLSPGVGFIIIDELTTKFDTDMILFSFFIAVFRNMGWLTLGALHGDSSYSCPNSPTPRSAASSLRMGFSDRQLRAKPWISSSGLPVLRRIWFNSPPLVLVQPLRRILLRVDRLSCDRPTSKLLTSRTDDNFVDIHISGLLNGIDDRPGDRIRINGE
jgi:hypothetical protein